ncbi:MAG TPA: tetratricopeptide repeat protein [Bdellovibrionales bacterium]|nr:tetratricopeptide repeat protein [Bdellovibrionales bacterium]
MKNSWFVGFMSILCASFVALHGVVRDRLSPVKNLEHRIELLTQEKESAEFRTQLANYRLSEYQQQVAALMPEAIKGKSIEAAYPLRQLASVVTNSDQLPIERASSLFEKAKQEFRAKNYDKSNRLFALLIETHPDSLHVIESHFLLSEGQFQLRDYDSTVATVEKMLSLFPDNELTAFALLRLGKIFEKQDRLEDAADIYRALLANFKQQPEVVRLASTSLKSVAL